MGGSRGSRRGGGKGWVGGGDGCVCVEGEVGGWEEGGSRMRWGVVVGGEGDFGR